MKNNIAFWPKKSGLLSLLFLLVLFLIVTCISDSDANEKIDSGRIAIIVENNDSLWSIARRIAPGYDTNEVIWFLIHLNGLESKVVRPGQSLIFDYAAIR
jgi:hypothetical protein